MRLVGLMLLLVACACRAANDQSEVRVGEYRAVLGEQEMVATVIGRKDGGFDVALMTSSKNCVGHLSFIGKMINYGHELDGSIIGFPAADENRCSVQLERLSDSSVKVRAAFCQDYHGANCDLNGNLEWVGEAKPGAAKRYAKQTNTSTQAFVERFSKNMGTGKRQPKEGLTNILSSPKGARIIVDGEFVGTAPVWVDLAQYRTDKYSVIYVKAIPAVEGCKQTEGIYPRQKLPRQMFFDTRLCPIQPEIDINLR